MKKRLSQPIGLHATPRPNARLFDLASDELATLRDVLPLDLPRVMGDRIQLQRVFLNLLLNAAEAMREVWPVRRRMVVRAIADYRDDGPWAIVSIENAGFGEAEAAHRCSRRSTRRSRMAGHRTTDPSLDHGQPPGLALGHGEPRGATFHVA